MEYKINKGSRLLLLDRECDLSSVSIMERMLLNNRRTAKTEFIERILADIGFEISKKNVKNFMGWFLDTWNATCERLSEESFTSMEKMIIADLESGSWSIPLLTEIDEIEIKKIQIASTGKDFGI